MRSAMSESVRSGRTPESEDRLAASDRAPLVTEPVAAGLAHDVKNLLAAIEGYAARAASELPATEGRAHLIQIRLAAAHAVELLQELDGRQPSSGRVPVDLQAICEEAVTTLARSLRQACDCALVAEDRLQRRWAAGRSSVKSLSTSSQTPLRRQGIPELMLR